MKPSFHVNNKYAQKIEDKANSDNVQLRCSIAKSGNESSTSINSLDFFSSKCLRLTVNPLAETPAVMIARALYRTIVATFSKP